MKPSLMLCIADCETREVRALHGWMKNAHTLSFFIILYHKENHTDNYLFTYTETDIMEEGGRQNLRLIPIHDRLRVFPIIPRSVWGEPFLENLAKTW